MHNNCMKYNCIRKGQVHTRILPVIVWFAALGVLILIFSRRVERIEVVGIARGAAIQVSSTTTGRLRSLMVDLFDHVNEGQVIAALEDSELQSQLATAQAEIKRLNAELGAMEEQLAVEASNRVSQAVAAMRRFDMDIAQAKLRILELKTSIEPALIQLEDLKVQIQIEEELLEKGASSSKLALEQAKINYNILQTQIEQNKNLLAQAEKELASAIERKKQYMANQPVDPSIDKALEPLKKAIEVQEKVIEELKIKRMALVLKSPIEGVISEIFSLPGSTVTPGAAILTITNPKPREVVAYLPENTAHCDIQGKKVQLITMGVKRQIAESQVIIVSPVIEQLPARLWPNPNLPQYGRAFIVQIPPELEVMPGEKVGVRGLQ